MRYRFGVEDMEPGHWVAWALDLPGCFSSGSTQQAAIDGAPVAVASFIRWRNERGRASPPDDAIEIAVEEVFYSYPSSDDYIVNAFFADDARPLDAAGVEEARWLLTCTRQDLLDVLERHPAAALTSSEPAGDRESVGGILRHIAVAERWYFQELGYEQPPLQEHPLHALDVCRAHSLRCLDLMVGNTTIREWQGERWSARKVVRRTLWHERDHTQQIRTLLGD